MSTSSRRILHIIDSLGRTGVARQLLLLAIALVKAGRDVHIVVLGQRGAMDGDFRAAGIPVTFIGRRWKVDPLADLLLLRCVARFRPDIVHTWDTVPGLFGPVACRFVRTLSESKKSVLKRLPYVAPRIVAGDYRINRWMPNWEWFIHRQFAHQVDRFITNSEAVRHWSVSHRLPKEKYTVLPAGVATVPTSDVTRAELLRELRLPPNAKLIGVVGRLTHEMRVKDLIWAADLLRVLHDNLRMLIIGDGPQREQLERYARLASDLEHIQFLGERSDVWRIMPHLDVLWNGSENIGLSISILEAMAAGVPVVASDTACHRELVIEGETGYLIPLGTRAGRAARARRTDRIFNDRTVASKLAAAAIARAATSFEASRAIGAYLRTYEDLAQR
jgi:glycosyltransferase involved in cell wall biosynthesis